MIRGTTPVHTFELPFDTAEIKEINIAYAHNGVVVLTKEKADCSFEGNTVRVRLTQEDTLKFGLTTLQIWSIIKPGHTRSQNR